MNRTIIPWVKNPDGTQGFSSNPVQGNCAFGCLYCYARRIKNRFGHYQGEPRLDTAELDAISRRRKPAGIFIGDMIDLMGPNIPNEFIANIISTIRLSPQHRFYFLTKNPIRYADWHWPENAWLGATVTNQADADERATILVEKVREAHFRYLSIEPMLGPVDLNKRELLCKTWSEKKPTLGLYLDWVILGGQTGPGAAPMHPDWVRTVRDQCISTSTPFFFKGWGEWALRNGSNGDIPFSRCKIYGGDDYSPVTLCPVGAKRSGFILDGKIWEEMPR